MKLVKLEIQSNHRTCCNLNLKINKVTAFSQPKMIAFTIQ